MESYIGKSKLNTGTRWGEHNNPTHNSEPAKHLDKNIQHSYYWVLLVNASEYIKQERT